MAFHDNLDYLMKTHGISNCQLAVMINCTQASVVRWRNGVCMPHTKTKQKIADFFLVDILDMDGDAFPGHSLPDDSTTKELLEIALSAECHELHTLIAMAKMVKRTWD